MTIEELTARVTRLEAHQDVATTSDVLDVRRDIASLAAGIGGDLREIRTDLASVHTDLREIRTDLDTMRGDISAIRRVLERGLFHWPWESRS